MLQQEKEDQAGIEALILSWEEPLQRIADDMELDVRFDEGHQAPMKELGEYAQQQTAGSAALETGAAGSRRADRGAE